MSLLDKTDVYQTRNERADRKHPEYGFVLVLVCMALTLMVAGAIFTPAPVGGGRDFARWPLAEPTRASNEAVSPDLSSVERDVSLFDHGLPFFRFGLEQHIELFWRRASSHHADVLEF